MAVSKKLVILSILFALIFTQARGDASINQHEGGEREEAVIGSDGGSDDSSSSYFKIELDQLKSKIVHLG